MQTQTATACKIAVWLCCFFSLSVALRAQCLLNYAKPLWAERFTNSNGLPAGKTSYLYDTSTCPQPGRYTIVDSVPGCFGRVIHADEPGSHFMFVASAANPGNVYTDTINNLCSGTINLTFFMTMYYATSRSACNGNPVLPYFLFSITTLAGQPLATVYTGNIVDTGEVEYGSSFPFRNIAGNTSVVIKIDNLSSGGCGNAFLIKNITVLTCGPAANADFADPSNQSIQICPSDSSAIVLKGALDQGYNPPAYQWQTFTGGTWVDIPGITALDYSLRRPTIAGAYQYRLTASDATNIANEGCRIASNPLKIFVSNRDAVSASNNSPVCENSLLTLSASGGTSFRWTGPNGFTSTQQYPVFTASKNLAGLYKVIVTAGAGCSDTATTIVNLFLSPVITVSNTQNICRGNSVSLYASGGTIYSWSPAVYLSDPATSNPVASPPASIVYNVAVTDTNHCTSNAAVLVAVGEKPVVNAGKDKVTVKGNPVLLNGTIQDSANVNFSWQPVTGLSNIHVLTPVANPDITTTYFLTATSGAGCGVVQDSVVVTVYNAFYIPNAFSPNGDGVNDVWRIPALAAFPQAKLSVYNRYGNKIFESTGGQTDWNGTYKGLPQPSGVYVFFIDLKNNSSVIKGSVLIVR